MSNIRLPSRLQSLNDLRMCCRGLLPSGIPPHGLIMGTIKDHGLKQERRTFLEPLVVNT